MVMPLIIYLIRQEKASLRRRGLLLLFLLKRGLGGLLLLARDLLALFGRASLLLPGDPSSASAPSRPVWGVRAPRGVPPKAWPTGCTPSRTYKQDLGLGRITRGTSPGTWRATRPIGGRFRSFTRERSSSADVDVHEAHSIYFQTLGSGFPGLAVFLAILGTSALRMQGLWKRTRGKPEFKWVANWPR